ncbi:MAG: FAD-dependent oxidoreductase [Acidobacteriota bacterium]
MTNTSILICGAGIVGLTVARDLVAAGHSDILIIDKEPEAGRHASGRNSGVLHAGIYYAPGSLRAQSCLQGNFRMKQYCEERGLPMLKTGKVICSSTAASPETRAGYLADHYTLPEQGGASVSAETLLAMIDAAEASGQADDWRRALIHLAHQRGELGRDLLARLEARVPRKLHDYWELAYAEAEGWLGNEYFRDDEGIAHIVPAGTLFGSDGEERPLN